jgi:hypothetical protein
MVSERIQSILRNLNEETFGKLDVAKKIEPPGRAVALVRKRSQTRSEDYSLGQTPFVGWS